MAFIGVFLVMLLFLALVISAVVFIASVTLFIISNIKKEKKVFRIIRIICIPTMCVSAIPVIISIIYLKNFGLILLFLK